MDKTHLHQMLTVHYRFTTYQDARRVRLVDGLIFETNILPVSPVKLYTVVIDFSSISCVHGCSLKVIGIDRDKGVIKGDIRGCQGILSDQYVWYN